MSWYEKEDLIFPKLHKCRHCKKRLSNPVISEYVFLVEGADEYYYCSETCAIAEKEDRKKAEKLTRELNRRIKG